MSLEESPLLRRAIPSVALQWNQDQGLRSGACPNLCGGERDTDLLLASLEKLLTMANLNAKSHLYQYFTSKLHFVKIETQ